MTDGQVNYDDMAPESPCKLVFASMGDASENAYRKFLEEDSDQGIAARILAGVDAKYDGNQSALARDMGVTRATVNQWVNTDHPSSPKPRHLSRLAQLLYHGDVFYLIHGPYRSFSSGTDSPPTPPEPTDPGASGRFVAPFKRSRKT